MTAAAMRRRMPARRRVLERLSRDTVAAFFMRRRAANCARGCDSIVSTGRKPQANAGSRRCANRDADCVAWSIHRDTESTHESGLRFREGQGDVGGAAQGLAAWRRDPVSRPPDARIAGRRLGRRDQRRHQRRGRLAELQARLRFPPSAHGDARGGGRRLYRSHRAERAAGARLSAQRHPERNGHLARERGDGRHRARGADSVAAAARERGAVARARRGRVRPHVFGRQRDSRRT
jgi:hypothetical protein